MILKILRDILSIIGGLFCKLALYIYQSPHERRVAQWYRDDGDKTHRLNYDLNKDSIVFDLGGYEGQWSSDIYGMYCCNIFIFEVVPEYAMHISKRFEKNEKVKIFNWGLANENKREMISICRDGSSVFKKNGKHCEISLVMASNFLMENNILMIDLMKINIEGGEYDLLEHLIDTSYINNIKNIQIQFHDFVPNATLRMHKIQDSLRKTHCLTYQYPFVWENWILKTM